MPFFESTVKDPFEKKKKKHIQQSQIAILNCRFHFVLPNLIFDEMYLSNNNNLTLVPI